MSNGCVSFVLMCLPARGKQGLPDGPRGRYCMLGDLRWAMSMLPGLQYLARGPSGRLCLPCAGKHMSTNETHPLDTIEEHSSGSGEGGFC